MVDCSPIYVTPHPALQHSPDSSPKALSQPDSAVPEPAAFQPQRASLSPSDPASTAFSSDNERVFSSGDEDSMEFQSDTAYDSVATRARMGSNSGLNGLEIERLFDHSSSPETAKPPLLALKELIPRGSFSESSQHDGNSLDGWDSLSTPRDDHSNVDIVHYDATQVAARENQPQPDGFRSSPPSTPFTEAVQCNTYPTNLLSAEMDNLNLLDGEAWDEEIRPQPHFLNHLSSPELPQRSSRRLSPPLLGAYQLPLPLPQHRLDLDETREDKRLSIFDWSEQQRSDRDSLYGSSPRPRTVHSKQAVDTRGGRATGRRAPNALHLRSQSVPVNKESCMDSDPAYPPAKFGTWGLGNKGVSEEWNDDFEFDEVDDSGAQNSAERSETGMRVPQAIIDRQASVHGQFGQVQEFMLLVEELKRLRHRGTLLGLIGGPSQHLWEDAESIINLATLNDEEEDFTPLQSPGFSNGFDDFDDDLSPTHRPLQLQTLVNEDESKTMPDAMSKAIPVTPPAGRHRGESLAQAKSFLQTMHQNRNGIESSPFDDRSHSSKLPFDTQDLRELVSRTGVVTRALKDVVRKAEGVFVSPDRTPKEPADPPFSQIFTRPGSSSPSSKKPGLPKSTSMNSYIPGSLAGSNNERDRSGHMNMMTVA